MNRSTRWGLTVAQVSLIALGLMSLTTTEALAKANSNKPATPSNTSNGSKGANSSNGSSESNSSSASTASTTSNGSSSSNSANSSNSSNSSEPKPQPLTLTSTQADLLVKTACSSATVTAGGVGYTACRGAFEGNDTGAGNPLLTLLNGGLFAAEAGSGTWTQLGKSDSGQFKADEGSTSGNWSLLTGQKLSGTFVLSLKASTYYSAYLFTNLSDITGGFFETIGVSTNKKGMAQGLSHASLFYLEGSAPSVNPNPPTNPQAVPEPMTLMGTGLAAVFGYRLKRKRDQKDGK